MLSLVETIVSVVFKLSGEIDETSVSAQIHLIRLSFIWFLKEVKFFRLFSWVILSQKMKLFQLVHKNFVILGIDSNHSMPQNAYLYNHKILAGFSVLGLTIISCFMYILREANTFFDYAQCICSILVTITIILSFMTFASKTSKLEEFYDFAEKNIEGEEKSVCLKCGHRTK